MNWVTSVGNFRDCYHETQRFRGDRYSLVAYTTRSLPEAPESARKRLRRMGFTLSIPAESIWQVDEADLPDGRPSWLAEAYPARAWEPPGDGEVMAMDTSGDEAHDGAQEPPSRAQRQALKKEVFWQAMSETEVPQFIQAALEEVWSSCRPVYVDVNKIDPSLILKSRVCFRWKPKGDGSYKPKAQIVIAGYRDPHLPLLSGDSRVLSRFALYLSVGYLAQGSFAQRRGQIGFSSGSC